MDMGYVLKYSSIVGAACLENNPNKLFLDSGP